MEKGKVLVGMRRLAKMSELNENIEPKTPSRAGRLHFLLGTKETPLTNIRKIGSTEAEIKMYQGYHCTGNFPTNINVTERVNI